jgi:hypothetical protein
MIGFKELLLLPVLLAVPVLLIVGLVWLLVRVFRKASHRTATERLAELESLRKAGQITTDEYEKQRAAIVSGI